MAEHVRVLGIIGLVRAVLGAALGGFLIWKTVHLDAKAYEGMAVTQEEIRFDTVAFSIMAVALLTLALLWALQGILAVRDKPSSRRLGLALAIVDIVNLVFFPISTALGLYGLTVYRHPSTVDYLESRRGEVSQGA